MSYYEFFKSCLKTTEETYNKLIETPRERGSHLQSEVFDILKQIEISARDKELTPSEANELKNAFMKFDFTNLSTARAALRKSEKMKQK